MTTLTWTSEDGIDVSNGPRSRDRLTRSQGKLLWTLVLPDGADYYGRYEAAEVHGITVFPAFDAGLSVENDGLVVRLLDLRGAAGTASQ